MLSVAPATSVQVAPISRWSRTLSMPDPDVSDALAEKSAPATLNRSPSAGPAEKETLGSVVSRTTVAVPESIRLLVEGSAPSNDSTS